jgi:hypothetical protein
MVTETKVKCKKEGCGHEWLSQAMLKNIEAGNVKCKADGCECTDLEVVVDEVAKSCIGCHNYDACHPEGMAADADPIVMAADCQDWKEAEKAEEKAAEKAEEKAPVQKPTPPPPKGIQQLQAEGTELRKKAVDTKNKNAAANIKAELEALADQPLNAEEKAFCLAIEPKLNAGRKDETPCPADMLRYSMLKGRMDIEGGV